MSLSKQLLLRLSPQKDKVFDNFLATNNRTAVDHLLSLCQSDKHQDNQTYLWGNAASGKSHLLQAVCSEVSNCAKSSIYLPLQQVEQEADQILQGLESIDLVCIDDIDLITHAELQLEHPLFHLINRLRNKNSCLIMAGRSNPRHLTLQLADLHSRLLWGSVLQLMALPDIEKPDAISLHAKFNGSEIPKTTITYLLNHYPRDMEYLIKVVNHISRVGFQCKRRLTVPFVKQVLKETNDL